MNHFAMAITMDLADRDQREECRRQFAHSSKRAERRAYRSSVRYHVWGQLIYLTLDDPRPIEVDFERAAANFSDSTGCDYESAYRFFKREAVSEGDHLRNVQRRIDRCYRKTPRLEDTTHPGVLSQGTLA